MQQQIRILVATLVVAGGAVGLSGAPAAPTLTPSPSDYTGMCCASAASAIDAESFVVADDEDSRLRIYSRDKSGAPLQTIDLTPLLKLDPRRPETDIEGAAQLGDKVFWIGSHSRNQMGHERLSRHQLFATRFTRDEGGNIKTTLVGSSYTQLAEDLAAAPQLAGFKLREAARLAPRERGALNIEGLAATPENHLLIGFRNPIPEGKALIVSLLNPEDVLKGERARLGEPIQLDLDGLGIRDMGFHDGKYLLIAGSFEGGRDSELFIWHGPGREAKRIKRVSMKHFNPEAVVFYPDSAWKTFQLLSDDGSRAVGGIECKDLANPAARHFRSYWISP